jgi:hypothetical protein
MLEVKKHRREISDYRDINMGWLRNFSPFLGRDISTFGCRDINTNLQIHLARL